MFIGRFFFSFHNVCFKVFILVLTYLLYEGHSSMIWEVLEALFFKLWIAVWWTVFYDLSICIYRDLKTKMSLFVSPGTAIVTSHSRKSRQVSYCQPCFMSKCKLVSLFHLHVLSAYFNNESFLSLFNLKIKQFWINDHMDQRIRVLNAFYTRWHGLHLLSV